MKSSGGKKKKSGVNAASQESSSTAANNGLFHPKKQDDVVIKQEIPLLFQYNDPFTVLSDVSKFIRDYANDWKYYQANYDDHSELHYKLQKAFYFVFDYQFDHPKLTIDQITRASYFDATQTIKDALLEMCKDNQDIIAVSRIIAIQFSLEFEYQELQELPATWALVVHVFSCFQPKVKSSYFNNKRTFKSGRELFNKMISLAFKWAIHIATSESKMKNYTDFNTYGITLIKLFEDSYRCCDNSFQSAGRCIHFILQQPGSTVAIAILNETTWVSTALTVMEDYIEKDTVADLTSLNGILEALWPLTLTDVPGDILTTKLTMPCYSMIERMTKFLLTLLSNRADLIEPVVNCFSQLSFLIKHLPPQQLCDIIIIIEQTNPHCVIQFWNWIKMQSGKLSIETKMCLILIGMLISQSQTMRKMVVTIEGGFDMIKDLLESGLAEFDSEESVDYMAETQLFFYSLISIMNLYYQSFGNSDHFELLMDVLKVKDLYGYFPQWCKFMLSQTEHNTACDAKVTEYITNEPYSVLRFINYSYSLMDWQAVYEFYSTYAKQLRNDSNSATDRRAWQVKTLHLIEECLDATVDDIVPFFMSLDIFNGEYNRYESIPDLNRFAKPFVQLLPKLTADNAESILWSVVQLWQRNEPFQQAIMEQPRFVENVIYVGKAFLDDEEIIQWWSRLLVHKDTLMVNPAYNQLSLPLKEELLDLLVSILELYYASTYDIRLFIYLWMEYSFNTTEIFGAIVCNYERFWKISLKIFSELSDFQVARTIGKMQRLATEQLTNMNEWFDYLPNTIDIIRQGRWRNELIALWKTLDWIPIFLKYDDALDIVVDIIANLKEDDFEELEGCEIMITEMVRISADYADILINHPSVGTHFAEILENVDSERYVINSARCFAISITLAKHCSHVLRRSVLLSLEKGWCNLVACTKRTDRTLNVMVEMINMLTTDKYELHDCASIFIGPFVDNASTLAVSSPSDSATLKTLFCTAKVLNYVPATKAKRDFVLGFHNVMSKVITSTEAPDYIIEY